MVYTLHTPAVYLCAEMPLHIDKMNPCDDMENEEINYLDG